MTAVSLVQGASRGIGLQFCRALLSRGNNSVIATCRNPTEATELLQLKEAFSTNLHVLPLDVTNESQIENAANDVKERYGKVDLLINSAGILHPSGRGETSLKAVSAEGLETTFITNTIGPLLMAKHFSQLLTQGNGLIGKPSEDKRKKHISVLVNMSAKVGSITDNGTLLITLSSPYSGLGGWYSYRMSKAALNMATKNLSIELGRGPEKVVVISLHPGTVDTELSRPYHKNVNNLFSLEHSVNQMMNVIDSLSIDDSGKFFLYNREIMPF